MNAVATRVDVLAVMELAQANLANLGCAGSAGDLGAARDAVATLIEAAHAWKQFEASKQHVEGGDKALYRKAGQLTDDALARVGGAA